MPDEVTTNNESEAGESSRLLRWWRRPTIREHKKRERESRYSALAGDREHARTRLPLGESVHLGGVVLTEIFTPSTLSNLVAALKRWPTKDERARQEWLDELAKSRTGERGGSRNLSMVRRPGKFIVQGVHDPDLPDGVEAVWLYMEYMLPSIVAVVATFTYDEEVGDLSPILKAEHMPAASDTRVHVYGRFGRIRARMPWARPANVWVGSTITFPDAVKRQACEDVMRGLEQRCRNWFVRKFEGRFAQAPEVRQPTIRLMFTQKHPPFTDDKDAEFLGPAGLHRGFEVYRESGGGWAVRVGEFPRSDRYLPVTVAARRKDVIDSKDDAESETIWVLTQRFGMYQAVLATRFALMNLLGVFTDRLANLRDRGGKRKRPRRPVSSARRLDDYLVGDGLDAATVAPEIERFTQDAHRFSSFGPKYVPDPSGRSGKAQASEAPQLLDVMRERLNRNATRFIADTERTIGNLRASAELRQAVANTRLQRIVIAVALAALIVALIAI